LPIPLRGIAVLLSWVVWPPVFLAGYWLINVFLASGRRCSIEGCDPPDGWLGLAWLTLMLGPPLYLTWRWLRRRRATPP
jgi:hypothetical protein